MANEGSRSVRTRISKPARRTSSRRRSQLSSSEGSPCASAKCRNSGPRFTQRPPARSSSATRSTYASTSCPVSTKYMLATQSHCSADAEAKSSRAYVVHYTATGSSSHDVCSMKYEVEEWEGSKEHWSRRRSRGSLRRSSRRAAARPAPPMPRSPPRRVWGPRRGSGRRAAGRHRAGCCKSRAQTGRRRTARAAYICEQVTSSHSCAHCNRKGKAKEGESEGGRRRRRQRRRAYRLKMKLELNSM